jgi:DNA-binding transcriptional MerR regulator
MPQEIPDKLYYRIGEVETLTGVPAYVLRYWESEFKLLRPKKNLAGQRLYRKRDLELVSRIKTLLYEERLTLEGARKRLAAESRRKNAQLDLGVKETLYAAALGRLRGQLSALRSLLVQDQPGGRP